MAYNETTRTLSKTGGLSISEVSRCLGEGSLDLGTLCTSENINKWAKYKPFRSASVHFATDNGESGTYLTDYEKARIASTYGFRGTPTAAKGTIITPEVTFSGAPSYAVNHADSQFGYYPPRGGGESEAYRLLDFDGYNHYASIGFKMEVSEVYYNQMNYVILYFGLSGPIEGYDSRNCLTPQDILDNLGDRYVGVLLTKEGSSTRYFISSGKKLSEVKGNFCNILFSGQTISGTAESYAVVSALAGDWKNSNIAITAVLAPASGYSDPSTCYNVTTSTPTFYSLEFVRDMDRATKLCGQDTSGMDLKYITRTVTASPTAGTTGITNDWHHFSALSALTLKVSAGDGWSATAKTLYYTLQIAAGDGGYITADGNIDSEMISITDSGSFSIARNGNYSITHTFASANTLFVYKELKTAYLSVVLTVSTQPNGEGSKTVFSNNITIGSWT